MKAVSILMLVLSLHAFATEVDDTLNYYEPIADSEAALNAMVQEQIAQARAEYFGCDLSIFGKRAAHYLTGNLFYGAIEARANNSLTIDKRTCETRDSIYRGTPYETSLVARIAPLASVVNLAGHHVGTDKIGHFFDMGYELYHLHKQGEPLGALVAQARREQQGLWGLSTTGVKSYGDISANFDGYRFWQDLLGPSANPYFVCRDGSLQQVRAFKWSDYVSAAWTEAINCSVYSSPEYQNVMGNTLSALESRSGRRYRCPIEPKLCGELRATYARWLAPNEVNAVISPACTDLKRP